MHYSPRIWPERDPELRVIFLSLPPLSPPLPAPGRLWGRLLVARGHHDSLRPIRIGGRLPAVFNNTSPIFAAAHQSNRRGRTPLSVGIIGRLEPHLKH